jgi:hypothetical protein
LSPPSRIEAERRYGTVDLATALEIADTLTVREAFDALRMFLELCWRREGRPVDEIAFILGGFASGSDCVGGLAYGYWQVH